MNETAGYINFSWIIEGKLAGHAAPISIADVLWLEQRGIKALVRLVEARKALISSSDVTNMGLVDFHVPINDFAAPTPVQSTEIVGTIKKLLNTGKAVGVSCRAGLGRTGTILACYLVSTGMSDKEAIKLVREKRPGSIETKEQEEAVTNFMNDLEIQKKWPKTVEEAVERILIALPEEDKETIRSSKSETDVAQYHLSLGMWVRNNFGLWHGNSELTQSCGGHKHADDNSTIILLALWHKLHEKSPLP